MNEQVEHEQQIHIKQVLYTSVGHQKDYCNTFCSVYLSLQKIEEYVFKIWKILPKDVSGRQDFLGVLFVFGF